MLHQMNIKVTNNFERNGAPYEQKTSACKEQSSWIPFNTRFVDTHQTDRNIAKRRPLPVPAQRIHTRYELRQNYTPRIARNHTGSIISITGKSSTIVCINGNPPPPPGVGVVMERSAGVYSTWFESAPCLRLELLF